MGQVRTKQVYEKERQIEQRLSRAIDRARIYLSRKKNKIKSRKRAERTDVTADSGRGRNVFGGSSTFFFPL